MNKILSHRVILLGLGFLLACGESSLKERMAGGPVEKEKEEPGPIITVRGYSLREQSVTNQLESPGFIGYKKKVSVVAPRSEIIISMSKFEGDRVRRGEMLFVLDQTSLKIEEEQYLAGVRQAEREVDIKRAQYENALLEIEKNILGLDRQVQEINLDQINLDNQIRILNNKKFLLDSEGISQEAYIDFQIKYLNAKEGLEIKKKSYEISRIGYRDQDIQDKGYQVPSDPKTRTEILKKINTQIELAALNREITALENAQSRLKSIRYLLSQSRVASPINGYIAAKGFELGEKADPAQPVYVLVNTDEVTVEAEVPESYYGEFQLGDQITFIVDASSLARKAPLISTINSINPVINPQTSTFQVKGDYRNTGSALRPGMFIKLYWKSSRGEAGLFVRQEDLLRFDYSSTESASMGEIFTAVNGRLAKKKVLLGKKIKNYYRVVQGLLKGDVVVVNESQILREGQPVKLLMEDFRKL